MKVSQEKLDLVDRITAEYDRIDFLVMGSYVVPLNRNMAKKIAQSSTREQLRQDLKHLKGILV